MMRSPSALKNQWIFFFLAVVVLLRLLTLGMYPLMDTTEARYAEIARKMVELGDWITPWFDYDVPFWGKPPMSFWATAASFHLFGINEFAARLPHWLMGIITVWLVWKTAVQRSQREALYAVILLIGSMLFYLACGMVMTDMALTLSVVIAMRGCWLSVHGLPDQKTLQRWLVFIGMGLGLLAKGPVALILIVVPIAVWVIASKQFIAVWRELPWVRGAFLTAAIALPWYFMAEQQTPGFLNYFLVGEHWNRFVVPGWTGDLYGSAHKYPHGTIWLFALADWLPWSVLLPLAALLWRKEIQPIEGGRSSEGAWPLYLLCWGLMPCMLFTFAGNILWAYVLPGMPALALWVASYLSRFPPKRVEKILLTGLVITGLACTGILINLYVTDRAQYKSAKSLVSAYQLKRSGNEPLLIFGSGHRFSAAFYSQGTAERIANIDQLLCRLNEAPAIVAIENDQMNSLAAVTDHLLKPVGQYGSFTMLVSKDREAGSPIELPTNDRDASSTMTSKKLPCQSHPTRQSKKF